MSPKGPVSGQKVVAASNVYTAMLGFACAIVIATAAFVAFKCLSQYQTLFIMP
ncbi:MAG: hypothetical protein ACYTBP_12750 [Planctomycetota bacterium]|jgi:hypothetical protein